MKLTPIKPKNLIKLLEKTGFSVRKQTGSHVILYKTGIRRPVSIPLHVRDLPTGTLRAIIRQAEISLEEFNNFS